MRAIWISPTVTVRDGGLLAATPADAFAGGLGDLVTRVAGRSAHTESVMMLDAAAAWSLGLPVDQLPLDRALTDHPALADLTRAGWQCSGIGRWSTITRGGGDGVTVHMGLAHFIHDCPLFAPWPADTVDSLAAWHEVVGWPWHHSSAVAGHAGMRELLTVPGTKHGPTWRPATAGPDDAVEDAYQLSYWRATGDPGAPYAHGLDANRAYVGAAGVVEVCPWTLRHERGRPVDLTRAGWWLVELPPWNEPRLPDPAGYDPTGQGRRTRLITTPTLALLEELTQAEVYGGVRVIESWTGPAKRLFRGWSERMRDAYLLRTPDGRQLDLDDVDADRIRSAVKDAGHGALGLFANERNWIYRPDWWYAIVAQARVNLWRRMWAASRAGHWPLQVDVDHVWYPARTDDWRAAAPPAFKLDPTGRTLGTYKPKGLRRRKDAGQTARAVDSAEVESPAPGPAGHRG